MVTAFCAASLFLTGCGFFAGGSSHLRDASGQSGGAAAVDSLASLPARPSPVAPAKAAAKPAPPPDSAGNPACPASDAWGRHPSKSGILVTVWSEQSDAVTVLVRTKSGTDRSQRDLIGPDERFELFEFPDVEATSVAGVLILTNTRRCYSMMDPATAAG